MKYKSSIAIDNKNNSHTLAFEAIEKHADGRKLKILEAGCASGYFGGYLTENGHEVWGVEPFKAAAEEATKVLFKVHNGTIEEFFSAYPLERFDAIVFGDVLEHLMNPGEVLSACKPHLSPNGIIVASVPNISHYAVRAMLLEGRWEYSDLGILDRTHVRFFNKNSLIDLFSDSGYAINYLDRVRLSTAQADSMCGMHLNHYSISAAEINSWDNCGTDFQYIVCAVPEQESGTSNISNARFRTDFGWKIVCLLPSPFSTLVDIRLRRQLQRWSSNYGGDFRILSLQEFDQNQLSWGDIFVLQREYDDLSSSVVSDIKQCGKKVIFEIDDYLLELPPFLAHHALTIENNREMREEGIRTADIVSVSTSILRDRLLHLNKNIHITPNFSESIGKECDHYESESPKASLIIASSDRVYIEMLVEPLGILQSEMGVNIIGIGPPGRMLMERGLTVDFQDNMSHLDFKRFIASVDNAIGLLPLDASMFSSCKSAVKYFDYSMANIPCICSNVQPYSDVIVDNKNGLLASDTVSSWVDALRKLIVSHETRKSIASAAKETVAIEHSLDVAAEAWHHLLKSFGDKHAIQRIDLHNESPWPINELEKLRTEVIDSRRSLFERDQQIAAFHGSTSWRVTRPLRWLATRIRRSGET